MSEIYRTQEFKDAVYNALNIETGKGEIQIKCPEYQNHKHGDATPSASLNRDSGLWVCYGCGAKGNTYQLAQACGLQPQDLTEKQEIQYWHYTSHNNMQLRVSKTKNKQFRQQTLRQGKWKWQGLDKGDKIYPLYYETLKGKHPLYIVEGEKDVDSLNRINLQATTNAGGAKALNKTDWSILEGFSDIIAIPDVDEAGLGFISQLETCLNKTFRVIDLSPHAHKTGFDISDYLQDYYNLNDLKPITIHEFHALHTTISEPEEPDPHATLSHLHSLDWHSMPEPFDERNARTLSDIFEKVGITIRYELRACERQIKINGHWAEIDDFNTSAIRELIRDHCRVLNNKGLPIKLDYGNAQGYWMECLNALLYEDERQVDSFLLWLENETPQWDGIERLNDMCSDLFETPKSDLTAWASRFLFIGPIQRAYQPACKLDEMPVFFGEQGTGKSTVIKAVLPSEHHHNWHSEGINFANDEKRFIESLLGRVIVEAGEMVGANRAENSLLKNLITRQYDSIRLTYDRHVTNVPRRCIIVGSTDSTEALPNDPAGNRRFVIIQLSHNANVNAYFDELCNETDTTRMQLWAEAVHLYQQGTRANLPPELYEQRNESNLMFRNVPDSVEDTILDCASTVSTANFTFTLAQLKAQFPMGFTASDRQIGAALRNNHYKKRQETRNGRRCWVYEPK